MMTRIIITLPEDQRDAVNTALEEGGFGPDNFSVPLYAGDDEKQKTPVSYVCDVQLTEKQNAVWDQIIKAVGGEFHDKPLSASNRLSSVLAAKAFASKADE